MPRLPHLDPEDKGRLISYGIGVLWSVVFATMIPSYYMGVVSQGAVWTWCVFVAVGCVTALVGVLTHRDAKVELSGVYLALFGSSFYLVAQIGFAAHDGFASRDFLDRVPALVFIAWHMSLLLPRLFGLESFRRRVKLASKGLNL